MNNCNFSLNCTCYLIKRQFLINNRYSEIELCTQYTCLCKEKLSFKFCINWIISMTLDILSICIGKVSCTLGDPVFSTFLLFFMIWIWHWYSCFNHFVGKNLFFVQSSFFVIFVNKKYLKKAVCKCENTNVVQLEWIFLCNLFDVIFHLCPIHVVVKIWYQIW